MPIPKATPKVDVLAVTETILLEMLAGNHVRVRMELNVLIDGLRFGAELPRGEPLAQMLLRLGTQFTTP